MPRRQRRHNSHRNTVHGKSGILGSSYLSPRSIARACPICKAAPKYFSGKGTRDQLIGPRLIDPYLQLKHQDIGLFVSRERSSGSTHLTPLQLLSLRQPFPSSESLLAENLLCFRRNPLVRGLCRKSPRLITPNLSADISHFVPVARSLSVKCQMS